MSFRVLVIDDDPGVCRMLVRGLTYEGYAVQAAPDGEQGLRMLRSQAPDLVILDVMLPGMDGLEVLQQVRAEPYTGPVLMLTARSRPEHQIAGFESGADDYVLKPFSFDVLAARVRAHLRRQEQDSPAVLEFADLTLDAATHQVRRAGRDVTLTAQEFRILQVFIEYPGRVLSKSVLLDRAWGVGYLGDPNIVETYVKLLRQKPETDGEVRLLQTIRGAGYVLRLTGP
ncbi:response regulator transcription factor [Deinococcus sp. UYEF24]